MDQGNSEFLYVSIIFLVILGLIIGVLSLRQGKISFNQQCNVNIDATYNVSTSSLNVRIVNGSISNAKAVILTENYYGLEVDKINSSLVVGRENETNRKGLWATQTSYLDFFESNSGLTSLTLEQEEITVKNVRNEEKLQNNEDINIYIKKNNKFHLTTMYFVRNNSAIEAPLGLEIYENQSLKK